MPCYDGYPDERISDDYNRRANELTRLLCEATKILKDKGLLLYPCASKDLLNWYIDHQAKDAERKLSGE